MIKFGTENDIYLQALALLRADGYTDNGITRAEVPEPTVKEPSKKKARRHSK